jgi:hypothetical protein
MRAKKGPSHSDEPRIESRVTTTKVRAFKARLTISARPVFGSTAAIDAVLLLSLILNVFRAGFKNEEIAHDREVERCKANVHRLGSGRRQGELISPSLKASRNRS